MFHNFAITACRNSKLTVHYLAKNQVLISKLLKIYYCYKYTIT